MKLSFASAGLIAASVSLIFATSAGYQSAKSKFGLIEAERLRPGSRVVLSPGELNAYVQQEVRTAVPEGVRDPRVELGHESATGTAQIDFGKLRRAQGNPPGWLMSKLLDGERPVKVTARIRSGSGRAVVDVQSVEISGMTIDGRLLDYLIHNYLLPRYPDAKIGEPFELGHRMEKIDVQPAQVAVLIGK